MKSNVQTIVDFVANQMDGESIPLCGSEAFNQLSHAITEIKKHQSSQELQMLAMHTLIAVIDRVSSNLHAEKAMTTFLRGGAND